MQHGQTRLFMRGRLRHCVAGCLAVALLAAPGAAFAENELKSLMTETPEEGFALAIKLSQKAVVTTQPDAEVRKALRGDYANNADSLIHVSEVVAINFRTVAEANNYWREE